MWKNPLLISANIGYALYGKVAGMMTSFGEISILSLKIFRNTRFLFRDISMSVEQMFFLGSNTLPLGFAVSAFVGIEAVLQAVYQFSGIIPLRYLGFAVRGTTVTELVPVILSMVFAGRISTSIAAEIANMKNTEQLDSMVCLSLDPVRYLFLPRVLACTFMLPVVVVIGFLISFVFSVITVSIFIDFSVQAFLNSFRMWFNYMELVKGVPKCFLFGFIIGIIGIYCGTGSGHGVQGVGNATGKAVTLSCVVLLVLDFIIAQILL